MVLVLFFGSCTSTKIYTKTSCHICLDRSEGILLLPLNWDLSFRKLSIAQQNSVERNVLAILLSEGFTKVALYDQLDYELLSAGIRDLRNPSERSRVNTDLGYPYFLRLSLSGIKGSDGDDYQSPEEANAVFPPSRTSLDLFSSIQMRLILTLTGQVVSDNTITTEIHEMGFTDDEGGVDYWNFGNIEKALRVSTRKGTLNLIKDCSCHANQK